jgi:hypothetical protein
MMRKSNRKPEEAVFPLLALVTLFVTLLKNHALCHLLRRSRLKNTFSTMADMMFALGQTKKKKTEENKVRQTKSELKDVNISETVEKSIRSEQHNREQKWKSDGRDQIKANANVTITDTVEKAVRSEQHSREQKWKSDGRDQIKQNTNFDMARSLFGGNTAVASTRADEEVEEEYVEEEVEEEE